ncbi:MAG: hypothetical protein ACT4QF_20910 [Sporichthyaceae bacterium]
MSDTICARCIRPVPRRGVVWPEGFVCRRCYQQATRRRGRCPSCGRERLLPGLLDATPVCSDCARLGCEFACTRCGEEDEPHRKGLCARCCLSDDLTFMLTGPDGCIAEAVRPVVAALVAQNHPRSAMIWLRNPEVLRLLGALADGSLPATHEALDAEPPSRTLTHLRDLLVHHGVLPPRDRTLLLFENWLQTFLADRSPSQRVLLAGFANWHHLRAMRPLAERQALKPGRAATARQELTLATQLLEHLDGLGVAPAELAQKHLDAWLAPGPSTRYTARTFVHWAMANGHMQRIEFPRRQAATTPVTAEDEQLRLLQRCLTGQGAASTRTRLAAVLVLLFAQPVTRICRLRLDDILVDGDRIAVRLGRTPAELPEALHPLVLCHLADTGNVHTAANADSPWLFPGGRAGQPMTANAMMIELRRAGLELRSARNAAMRSISLDLPAAIAADVLGLFRPAVGVSDSR